MSERKKQISKYPLEVVIQRRNARLRDFFRYAIPEEVGHARIIGDDNSPAIILNDNHCLSCYVHNFDLRLNSQDTGGELVMTIKLNAEPQYDRDAFLRWLYGADHKKVYRVHLAQTPNDLYLCGWNYIDKENSEGRYPVFSKFNSKVYFKKNVCEEVASELNDEGYLVDVV